MPRKKPKRQPLANRLYQDEALQAIARFIGYSGRAYPLSESETRQLYDRFGKERIQAAAAELLDYDAETKTAMLKPDARKLCFGLLGPAPEQEDWFYRNPDGTPSERSKRSEVSSAQPSSNPWETARTIAVVKEAMRESRRKLKACPIGSRARDAAEDELNRLREELSYAADRLACARHAEYTQPVGTRHTADSAQAYVVWKLGRTRDELQTELEAAQSGHRDEQVIQALAERLARIRHDLRLQAEELLHDMVN